MNTSRFGIGLDVLLFDPERRAKPIGGQFAARDQPPDLLLAKAQMPGGLFDGVKVWLLGLVALGWVGVFVIGPTSQFRRRVVAELGWLSPAVLPVRPVAAPSLEAMTSRAAWRAKRRARRPRAEAAALCLWRRCSLGWERTFVKSCGHGRSRSAASCGVGAVLRLSAGRPLSHHFGEVMITLDAAAVHGGRTVAMPV